MKETVTFDFYSGMKEIKFRRPRIKNSFILNFVDFFPSNFIKMKVILHQLLFQFSKANLQVSQLQNRGPLQIWIPRSIGPRGLLQMPPWQLFLPTPFHKPISLQITLGDFRPMGKGVIIFILQKKGYFNKLSQKNRNREITMHNDEENKNRRQWQTS